MHKNRRFGSNKQLKRKAVNPKLPNQKKQKIGPEESKKVYQNEKNDSQSKKSKNSLKQNTNQKPNEEENIIKEEFNDDEEINNEEFNNDEEINENEEFNEYEDADEDQDNEKYIQTNLKLNTEGVKLDPKIEESIEKANKIIAKYDRDHVEEDDEEDVVEPFERLPPLKNIELNPLPNSIPVQDTFDSLPIHDSIKLAIKDMGFDTMLDIQKRVIPEALLGRDILASARTGAGKTFAFLIPALELILQAHFKVRNGTGVIVISPTRELALQTYGIVSELLKYEPAKTFNLVTGGSGKGLEEKKLTRGANVVICTPGRLLDHLSNTKGFYTDNLRCLVLDEADRLLELGFEEELKAIVRKLPKERQTLMFSATQTRDVKDLAKLSLNHKPVEIHVDIHRSTATVDGLEQGYVICDSTMRFLLLLTFLKKNLTKKIMVFFSSCASVKFHTELLNFIDVPVLSLHGQQKQLKRSKTFFEFKNSTRGILLSTDVAARGLDIPAVDWIVQFDPPDDPKEYIHRVGRTARGVNGKGHALLFLLPTEVRFLKYLQEMKVPLEEFEFPKSKILNVQAQLEKIIEQTHYLGQSAVEGFKGYIRSYASHSQQDIFDLRNIDYSKVATSFGLKSPPTTELFTQNKQQNNARYGKVKKSIHGKFSSQNPNGKRDKGDTRQFTRF